MKLSALTDEALLSATITLVKQEKNLLAKILRHLREVDRRHLYATLSCASLFAYLVEHLGYSEDQATRRIAALRLLQDFPEIEEAVADGRHTLSNLVLAKRTFARTRLGHEEKTNVLKEMEGTSLREAERILSKIAPLPPAPDRIRSTAEDEIEIRLNASESLRTKIETLKGLLAHKHPQLSLGELFEKLCDLGIEQWSPAEESPAAPRVDSQAEVRRAVWRKAHSRCEKCGSRHALEIDHIRPRSQGGGDTIDNLRLLCRSCNQRAAREVLGAGVMDAYRHPE